MKQSKVIHILEENLSAAWEQSIIDLYECGREVKTQYDKPDAPYSIDATGIIEIINPFAEPRIHKCFPGGIVELETYRQEVVDGIHDHWVCPEEGKWEYTYSERLTKYTVPGLEKPINQIEMVIDNLKKCPYTRRAQAVTWKAWEDSNIVDPACLQIMWFRVIEDKLELNVHMRSNDAFKAAFMNMYAFTDLQRLVAEQIDFPVGRYTHIADSYHIYSSYFDEIEGFLNSLETRTFEERTYRSDDPLIVEIIEEAKEQIKKSLENEKLTGRKGL
jgi:thymidylate synthase